MDRIELFSSNDGTTSIEVRLTGETVWLTQHQIAELFETSRENITMHLRKAFSEGELTRRQHVRISYRFAKKVSVIDSSALSALTLLVAMSDLSMTSLIVRMLTTASE
ncbi:hypothetical protein [Brevibacterium oceani]|uniref:hypothetical protein n=1 Tax=Brevibacterium oceani TaxID=358099 RepID=UPI0015E639AF|nr:hypothetical protein [Brevibacterium oceani]